MIYALILISLNILGLGVHLAKHGEENTTKYNFFIRVITVCLVIWLYYKVGVFNNF